jgi:hypothetical protein
MKSVDKVRSHDVPAMKGMSQRYCNGMFILYTSKNAAGREREARRKRLGGILDILKNKCFGYRVTR